MRLLLDNFVENGLVHEPPQTLTDTLINFSTTVNQDYLMGTSYIRPLLNYGESWTMSSDMFQYMKQESLDKLRNDPHCFLFFDASMEGFSPFEVPIARSLEKQCIQYNIDPRKIYFLTANFKESDCYNNHLAVNGPNYGINIVETTNIADMVMPNQHESADYHLLQCKKHHTDKIFLQLSRRNRPYRIMANYVMAHSKNSIYGIISQDKVNIEQKNNFFYIYRKSPEAAKNEITEREFDRWNEKDLPAVADNTDFQVNWASWRSPDLYHKTLFSVVLETSMRDLGGTTIFPSEKIFKAMIHRHPFIAFGHRGINHHLKMLGFRTYEQWFDISSFDFETDPYIRYKKICQRVNEVVDQLKKMSIQERIHWRFMNREILDHNYNLIFGKVLKQREAMNIHKTVKSYVDGNFFSYLSVNPHTS